MCWYLIQVRIKMFVEPWESIDDSSSVGILKGEVRKEVAPSHVLFGKCVRAIARRIDCDDVLFELQTGQVACVHLTWSSNQETVPWPSTQIYSSLQAFIATRMQDDVALY